MTQGVARLKELLFDNESQALNELEQRLHDAGERIRSLEGLSDQEKRERLSMLKRLEQLFERAGTEERFSSSVAVVLDRALREAELRNHDELARALAPLVIQTVKTELKNSQDEMVEILYPLTGKMVKSYIATAMKDLTHQLNNRIDQNPMMLRIRSWTTGKSVAELAIAESQRLQVEEVYLIRRGSGELLGRWPSTSDFSNAEIHMGGVLAAINEFATNTFIEDGGSFRTFEVDEFQVFLRASPVYLLAAKCRGIAPAGIETIFDEEFLSTLTRLAELEGKADNPSSSARSQELKPLATHVEARTAEIYEENARSGFGGAIVKFILFMIAVPLLAWFFWGLYTDAEEAIARGKAQTVLDAKTSLAGYPTSLDVGYRGKTVTVSGLAPDLTTRMQLSEALKAALPDAKLNNRLTVVPAGNVDPRPIIESVQQRLDARDFARVRRWLDDAQAQMTLALPEIDRLVRALGDPAQKTDVRETQVMVAEQLRGLDALLRQWTNAEPLSDKLRDEMSAAVHKSAGELASAIANLNGIIGANGAARPPVDGPAGTLTESAETLSRRAARLMTLLTVINQTASQVPPATAPREATPQERLAAFVERNAVFFSNNTDYADPGAAREVLDRLAALMKQTDDLVRVVGYTDVRGGQTQNDTLSQQRADVVRGELQKRGVPANRLVAIGRRIGPDISPAVGTNSPNRRVQFEMGFKGEKR